MSVVARSTCVHCAWTIELTDEPDAAWTVSNGPGLSGRNPECNRAPNPDDGPMPGHQPGIVAYRHGLPPVGRCDVNARRGTGTGACNQPLDSHGGCPRAGDHID